jgi:hypothetical protein
MFGLTIQGRLGNQLFQYTYAKVLSKKFNTSFFLLNSKTFYLDKYFDIKVKSPLEYRLKALQLRLKNFFIVSKIIDDQTQPPEWNMLNERDNAIYIGYHQSEQYHAGMAEELKRELRIKPQYQINIRDFVPNDKPNIIVHVRRTDYITFGSDYLGGINLTLPLEYYKKALAELPTQNCNIVFLSDDIAFVKRELSFPNAIYAENNTEIVDFQLIMQGDYLVLANSSFSWWGAYLNAKVKKVIAPKYWLGIKVNIEHPKGVLNVEWEKIN